MKEFNEIIVVIPSLEPNRMLIDYINSLINVGFRKILLVDDGSSLDYQSIFEECSKIEGVEVLHHTVNMGKGRALKTAFSHILDNYDNVYGVITADSDGQHLATDCLKVTNEMMKSKEGLFLGTRDFNNYNVPFKSRYGNKITSFVFRALYGKWLDDTQTGLRGILKNDLRFMVSIKGERFEYETQMLIDCVRNKIPIVPVNIETVYINDNVNSHFNAFKDSFKIYSILFKKFAGFIGSSLFCTFVDFVVYCLTSYFVLPLFGVVNIVIIDWVSGFIARLLSSCLNFYLNKTIVFKFKGDKKCILKYALLCIAIICISNFIVSSIELLGGPRWLIKPICDGLLFLISYSFQSKWVFRE